MVSIPSGVGANRGNRRSRSARIAPTTPPEQQRAPMVGREGECMTIEGGVAIGATALAGLVSKLRAARNTGKNPSREPTTHFRLQEALHSEIW